MSDEIYSEAVKKVFFNPISFGGNRLCILSDQASPSMASWLLKTYEENDVAGISIELIITSAIKQGILETNHSGFKELHQSFRKGTVNHFVCSYYYGPLNIENNLYLWLKDETPITAFSCSCDFTQSSMLKKRNEFSLNKNVASAYEIFESAVNNSIYCINSEVEDYISIVKAPLPASTDLLADDPNYICLSLIVNNTGEPGRKSGLNWGQRENRNPNEAYIPLPRKIAKSGFFPLNKQHFLVVTDDHHTLLLRVEQQNDKAITTPASNAQLGEYFRNRLGLANGARVHTRDLDAYGRRDVSFYKIDDEQFYMDFSVNKERNNHG